MLRAIVFGLGRRPRVGLFLGVLAGMLLSSVGGCSWFVKPVPPPRTVGEWMDQDRLDP